MDYVLLHPTCGMQNSSNVLAYETNQFLYGPWCKTLKCIFELLVMYLKKLNVWNSAPDYNQPPFFGGRGIFFWLNTAPSCLQLCILSTLETVVLSTGITLLITCFSCSNTTNFKRLDLIYCCFFCSTLQRVVGSSVVKTLDFCLDGWVQSGHCWAFNPEMQVALDKGICQNAINVFITTSSL